MKGGRLKVLSLRGILMWVMLGVMCVVVSSCGGYKAKKQTQPLKIKMRMKMRAMQNPSLTLLSSSLRWSM